MAVIWLLLLQTVLFYASTVNGRPHKVHGLLLYPDKKAWCETKEIEMVITHPHCTPKKFSNRVCVGQCFSYATPRSKPPNQVEDKLKYCDQCRPSNTTWVQITLDCADSSLYQTFTKDVEIIEECSCQACTVGQQPNNDDKNKIEDNTSPEVQDELSEEFALDENGKVMSREEYMVQARHKLHGEDHGVVASREDIEKHGKTKHDRKSWIERRYRHLDRAQT